MVSNHIIFTYIYTRTHIHKNKNAAYTHSNIFAKKEEIRRHAHMNGDDDSNNKS